MVSHGFTWFHMVSQCFTMFHNVSQCFTIFTMFHTYHRGRLVPVAGMILVDGMVINGAALGGGDSNSYMAMIRFGSQRYVNLYEPRFCPDSVLAFQL